jgi:hypothetical protein
MIDETAAAYGLFQVSFTWLEQQLAAALYHLRQIDDPSKFEDVLRQNFSDKVRDFKKQLKNPALEHEGAKAAEKLGELAAWRNERVHARVEVIDQPSYQFALYSARTRERLLMTPEELRARTAQAIMLVDQLNWIADFHKTSAGIAKELQELLASAEGSPSD